MADREQEEQSTSGSLGGDLLDDAFSNRSDENDQQDSLDVEPAGPLTIKQQIKAFWDWLRPIVIVVLVITLVRSMLIDWNDVPTGSMNPNIVEGDRIVVNKLAYGLNWRLPFTQKPINFVQWGTPDRGDIVTFWHPDSRIRMVKRVIALPGDTVRFRNGVVYVNGEALEQTFVKDEVVYDPHDQIRSNVRRAIMEEEIDGDPHQIQFMAKMPVARNFPVVGSSFKVPEGHYFMVGDNRDRSSDSRWFNTERTPNGVIPTGEAVPIEDICGRAFAVAWSLEPTLPLGLGAPRWERFFSDLD